MMASDSNWNQATLSGCTDIIVVEQPDGTLASTQFNVRFGKFKVFRTKKKHVKIAVNGIEVPFTMKLTHDGTGIFEDIRESILVADEEESIKNPDDINPSILAILRNSSANSSNSESTRSLKSEENKSEASPPLLPKDGKGDKNASGGFRLSGEKKEEGESRASDWEDDDQTGEVGISLCGKKLTGNKEEDDKAFKKYKVTYKTYAKKPSSILNDSNLVIRYKDEYYNWENASQMLLSLLVYQKDLPEELQQKILKKQKKGILSSIFSFGKSSEPTEDKKRESLSPGPPEASERSVEIVHTATPTSDMLKSLNLHYGKNVIEYTVKSKLRGTSTLKADIYYFRTNIKIIVSDVDGTITKSDVRGQLYPMFGMDWSQVGISELYTKACQNGYTVLYLTARSMGQSDQVREYITKLEQGDYVLPTGPVMTSADRLGKAFKREIIERQPHIFKIAFLQEVRNLFPVDVNPFFAGFGNRITDRLAYECLEMEKKNIYIVNKKGEIMNEAGEKTSYPDMVQNMEQFFPKIN